MAEVDAHSADSCSSPRDAVRRAFSGRQSGRADARPRRHTSLRSLLSALVVVVAVLAFSVCGALVFVTTILERTTARATAAAESLRLAEETETDLLLHERAKDPLIRRDVEADLWRKLDAARQFVTTEDEKRIFAAALTQLHAYLDGSSGGEASSREHAERLAVAYAALEALVRINAGDAKGARESAARWNRAANLVGTGIAALVILATGVIVAWLRCRAFEPVLSLAQAMERFGRGERDARAPERGAAELQDMSRRFNEMAAAIAEQRHSQMAFLGGVAHDLRNPLSILRMTVATIHPDKPLPSESHLRRVIQRIDRQITSLDRMVGDLLDLAKIEAGELELELAAHDARVIVREVASLFEQTLPEHRLEVWIPDEPVPVYCDPLRIEQVVMNLISNALKYSPPASSVAVAVRVHEAEVVVSVSDHGKGISEGDRERLFEPFRRLDRSTDMAPGVGLGLSVVRRIVQAHGGRIEVESAQGRGSTFRVFLPHSTGSSGFAARLEDAPAFVH